MASAIERFVFSSSSNEQNRATRELYLKIIGRTSFPDTPDDLPKYLYLPSGLVVPIIKAMRKTDLDGIERGGNLQLNSSKEFLISRRLRIGTKSLIIRSPRSVFPRIFGQTIADWHSHPSGDYLPSNHDLATFGGRTSTFIELVGSRGIISAMLTTNQLRSMSTASLMSEYFTYDFDKARKATNIGIGLYVSYRTNNGFEFIKQMPRNQ